MLANEVDTLIDLSSKLKSAGSRLNGARIIDRRIEYLELQERCETLLEDVNRGYGDKKKHISEVRNLERNVDLWLAQLNDKHA